MRFPSSILFAAFLTTLAFAPLASFASAHSSGPSSPDAPLPRAEPAVELARQAHDQAHEVLREARRSEVEVGRPWRPEPTASWPFSPLGGSDPVVNLDSGLGYSSLQAAINAASAGDTLEVVEDLDEGPVTVDKDLFVRGATGTEVVRPTQDTGTTGDARGWFLVDAGAALSVRDLTFDGAGFQIFQGFRHRGFGLFERVHFRNLTYEPSGPLYQGSAIVAFGDRVDVLHSSFEQIGRVGTLFFGAALNGSVYRGNLYVGKGDGDFLDYGVELNGGAGVWVLDNELRDCRGVASVDGSTSAGILATTFSGAGTAMLADGNNLVDNTSGMAIGFPGIGDSTAVAASFNRLFDNTFGINTASSVPVAAEDNWWGCNDGPGGVGCDGINLVESGNVDSDPWLVFEARPMRGLKPHGIFPLRAWLIRNSDGVDTSSEGHVPNGIPGFFLPGSLGTTLPATVYSFEGRFSTLFVAGDTEGSTTATLTVDNQTEEKTITITEGLFCDGFESGNATAWDSEVP